MNGLKAALIICAIIGIVFLILFAVAGIGSVESASGHYVKDTLKGTVVENPASNLEAKGNSLTSWAHGAIMTLTGLIIIGGFIYVGAKTKY
jgi:hypothetical protein